MSRGWGGRRATELTIAVLATKGTICHLCGLPGANTADHIIPRAHGGLDEMDNLMPAHKRCNSSRGAMLIAEWRRRHPLPDRAPPTRRW